MPGSSTKSFTSVSTPNEAEVLFWYNWGESLANQGNHSDALTCFERVLSLQETYGAAWTFRGVELIHLNRFQEALESCDRALELDPNDSEAWIFRGVALHRMHQYRAAYTSYDRALGIQRQPFWKQLGQRFLKGWKF